MKFKAVLFDLDGTLLNTIDDLGDSMNNVLKQLNFPQHSIEAYKYFVGDGLEVLVRRSLPQNYDEDSFKKAFELMRSEYGSNWDKKTKPYDGIEELLARLSSLGIKLAILTNKPDDTAQKVVGKFMSKFEFDVVFGQRKDVPKKPNPEGALEVAEMMGLECKEFLYLGDTKIDMQTANSYGDSAKRTN